MRPDLLALLVLASAAIACSKSGAEASSGGDPAPDAGDEAPVAPTWQGDAGLLARAPAKRPLHELCGIASNPGDFPTGDDAVSAAKRKGYLDAALDLGGVMIRRDFEWQQIEPTKGASDYTPYDQLMSEAGARGVRILGSLLYGTTWANPAATDQYFPPKDPADFAAYASRTATRYAGNVVGWEIWNEPNGGWRFWKGGDLSGDPVGYGTLLAAAHDALRAADPTTPVLLGGTVFTPQLLQGAMQWLGRAYDARPDLATKFEVAGIHTYQLYPPVTPPELGKNLDAPLEAKVQMHAWLLAQHGADGKPIFITELGWPVYDKVDLATQARFLVRATILAAHAGAEGIFWYTLRDGPHPEAFPPEDAFGLLHDDGDFAAGTEATKKPVYVALKALLAQVGERWATTEDPGLSGLPADGHAVLFRAETGSKVVATWTVTTPSATVTATAGGKLVDEMGAESGQVAAGGTFAIGPDVSYLVVP